MKYMSYVLLAAIVAAVMSGCSTAQTLADGLSQKIVSSSGTVAYGRVGLDPTTATPEAQGLFVWGDYASVPPNSGEVFRYERTDDTSVFNSASKTTHTKLFFASSDPDRVDRVLEAVAALNKDAPQPKGESE